MIDFVTPSLLRVTRGDFSPWSTFQTAVPMMPFQTLHRLLPIDAFHYMLSSTHLDDMGHLYTQVHCSDTSYWVIMLVFGEWKCWSWVELDNESWCFEFVLFAEESVKNEWMKCFLITKRGQYLQILFSQLWNKYIFFLAAKFRFIGVFDCWLF
jgi:hypothetical protein